MNRSKIVILFFALFVPLVLCAQPRIEWAWSFEEDTAMSFPAPIDLLEDGGCVVAASLDHDRHLLLRFDAQGNLLLQALIPYSEFISRTEGGFVIANNSRYVVRLDEEGSPVDTLFDGGENCEGLYLQRSSNGVTIATQRSGYDEQHEDWWAISSFYMFDFEGTQTGNGVIDGSEQVHIANAFETTDGGLIIAGGHHGDQAILHRRGTSTNWTRYYESADSDAWLGYRIAPTAEGGVALLVFDQFARVETIYDPVIRLLRYDAAGTLLDTREILRGVTTGIAGFDYLGADGYIIQLAQYGEGSSEFTYLWVENDGTLIDSATVNLGQRMFIRDTRLDEQRRLYITGITDPNAPEVSRVRVMRLSSLTAPPLPSNLTIASGNGSVRLSWIAPEFQRPFYFEIQHASSPDGPYEFLDAVTNTVYTRPLALGGQKEFYRVVTVLEE